MRKIRVLTDQSGMQVLEVIGLAVMGLIVVALVYNATKGGLNTTSNKIGTALNTVGSGNSLPNQLNP